MSVWYGVRSLGAGSRRLAGAYRPLDNLDKARTDANADCQACVLVSSAWKVIYELCCYCARSDCTEASVYARIDTPLTARTVYFVLP